jgi:hypothetical protein
MGIWPRPCKKVHKFVKNSKSWIMKSRFHCILNVFSTEHITPGKCAKNHLLCFVSIHAFISRKHCQHGVLKTESGPPQWEAASNCLSYGMAQVRSWYKYIYSLNSITYSTDYINIITE